MKAIIIRASVKEKYTVLEIHNDEFAKTCYNLTVNVGVNNIDVLDKQRVREAIEKVEEIHKTCTCDVECQFRIIDDLKKELGL